MIKEFDKSGNIIVCEKSQYEAVKYLIPEKTSIKILNEYVVMPDSASNEDYIAYKKILKLVKSPKSMKAPSNPYQAAKAKQSDDSFTKLN